MLSCARFSSEGLTAEILWAMGRWLSISRLVTCGDALQFDFSEVKTP